MIESDFRERLLKILDQKNHWGWKKILEGKIPKSELLIHFQQEFEVYIRDFPILLSRVLGKIPKGYESLKRELAENLFEEQTGGLSKKVSGGRSHPELFLKMMKGLQYSIKNFEEIELLPTSLGYRSFLDLVTLTFDWRIGAAVLVLFVEGSVEDRDRLKKNYKPRESVEAKIKNHSLHKVYGLKASEMDLIRVHHLVEGDHRKTAWQTLLQIIPKEMENEVERSLRDALDLWLLYRDGICLEMNLEYPQS